LSYKPTGYYRLSLWVVRWLQNGQYFLYSTRPLCFRLFFVVV